MPRTRPAHAVRRPPHLAAACAAAAMLSAGAPVRAQTHDGFALDRFQPSYAGDPFFGVESPTTAGEQTLHAMLLIDYAHHPLVLRNTGGTAVGAIVGNQIGAHLDASFALARVVTFNLDVPFSFQAGDAPASGFPAPSAAAFGDVRLGVRATIVGEETDPFQLAIGALIWLPTGSTGGFSGDGTARGEPQLIAGGRLPKLVWAASIGPELRSPSPYAGVEHGPSLRWGAGFGFLLGALRIGPEAAGSVTLGGPGSRSVDVEALAGARLRFARSFVAGAGIGPAFGGGAGAPDVRAVASLSYSPEIAPRVHENADRDGDGIPDAEDACVDVPGVRDPDPSKNGCPKVPDRDGDGIPDADDACPDVPGVPDPVPSLHGCPPDRDNDRIPDSEDACPDQMGPRNADPKKNGCPGPADRDHDGIPDDKDACPDVPGVPDPDPAKNGCPGDRDGDGIRDDKDACPDEKGRPDPDPAKNGCPKDVRVTDGEIVILEQIQFDLGKATIRKVSHGLLDNLAQVFNDHPEILSVEVQGHTDDRGPADGNTKLSKSRAEAVVEALAKRGVASSRLVARGYGPTRPIAKNTTDIGRAKNRRVEFKILEKRPKKAQGAKP